jgi:RNA polymerase sigma factor (sigma-70 family)
MVNSTLTADEERDLAARIQLGGQDGIVARNILIERNRPLVILIAKDYRGRGMDMADLVQEGVLGLIRACKNFDPETYGTRFSTYAKHCVNKAIRHALANQRTLIRVPYHAWLLWFRHRRGIPITQKQEKLIPYVNATLNISVELFIQEKCVASTVAISAEDFEKLHTLINDLSPLERTIIQKRYGDRQTQADTGAQIGYTKEWVGQIERRILARMRSQLE